MRPRHKLGVAAPLASAGMTTLERMNPLDAWFLYAEEDGVNHMNILSFIVLDGPPPPYEDLLALVASKLPQLPRYRQVVRTVPMHIGRPGVGRRRELRPAVPRPPDRAAGAGRRRGARAADLAPDGAAVRPRAAAVGAVVGRGAERRALGAAEQAPPRDGRRRVGRRHGLDPARQGARAEATAPTSPGSRRRRPRTSRSSAGTARGIVTSPVELARAASPPSRRRATPRRPCSRASAPAAARFSGGSASSMNGPIGPSRRYTWTSYSLADVKRVRKALGGTLNDIVVATATSGFRDLLLSRGEDVETQTRPRDHPDRPARAGREGHRGGGRLVREPASPACSPTCRSASPIRSSARGSSASSSSALKASREGVAGDTLTKLSGFAPATFLALGQRAAAKVQPGHDQLGRVQRAGPAGPALRARAQGAGGVSVAADLPGRRPHGRGGVLLQRRPALRADRRLLHGARSARAARRHPRRPRRAARSDGRRCRRSRAEHVRPLGPLGIYANAARAHDEAARGGGRGRARGARPARADARRRRAARRPLLAAGRGPDADRARAHAVRSPRRVRPALRARLRAARAAGRSSRASAARSARAASSRPFDERDDGLDTSTGSRGSPGTTGPIGMAGRELPRARAVGGRRRGGRPARARSSPTVTASQFHGATYGGGARARVAARRGTRWSPCRSAARRAAHARPPRPAAPAPTTTSRSASSTRACSATPARSSASALERTAPTTPTGRRATTRAESATVEAAVLLIAGWHDMFVPWQLDDYVALRAAGRDVRLHGRAVGAHLARAVGGRARASRSAWLRAHLLGDERLLRGPRVRVYVGGSRRVARPARLAAAARTRATLHLQPGGGLTPARPAAASAPDATATTPPTRRRRSAARSCSRARRSSTTGRSSAAHDVLVYTTAPLERDLEAIGPVRAELFVRSTLEHFDVFVRVCDVDRRRVAQRLRRARARRRRSPRARRRRRRTRQPSSCGRSPIASARGHRIRVQVSSGAHPRYARNPGTGEPLASATTLVAADQEVFHDPGARQRSRSPSCEFLQPGPRRGRRGRRRPVGSPPWAASMAGSRSSPAPDAGRGSAAGIALELARAGADVAVHARAWDEDPWPLEEIAALGRRRPDRRGRPGRARDREPAGRRDRRRARHGRRARQQRRHRGRRRPAPAGGLRRRAVVPDRRRQPQRGLPRDQGVPARRWSRAEGGAIVNISSIAGRQGQPRMGAYVATKWAVIGLTRQLALEYAPDHPRQLRRARHGRHRGDGQDVRPPRRAGRHRVRHREGEARGRAAAASGRASPRTSAAPSRTSPPTPPTG